MAVRTFVALELSPKLKDGILSLIEEMKQRGVRASWSRPSTMHLTLKFLGDVEEEAVPGVVRAVRSAAAGVPVFSFVTRSVGAFPSLARPSVVWVGVAPVDELFELHAEIERRLRSLGFPRERRRFRPHITVGRLRGPAAGGFGDLLGHLEAPEEQVVAREVWVMKSTLSPGGAIHEPIAAAPLAGGTDAPER